MSHTPVRRSANGHEHWRGAGLPGVSSMVLWNHISQVHFCLHASPSSPVSITEMTNNYAFSLCTVIGEFASGVSDVHGSLGSLRPSLSTVQALGRVFSSVQQYAQADPRGGYIMSANVNKRDIFWRNSQTLLTRKVIKKYVGFSVRFRNRSNHLRCNVCVAARDGLAKMTGTEKEIFYELNRMHFKHIVLVFQIGSSIGCRNAKKKE